MARYLITLQYDGTNYHGFQIQDNANTVQAEVEKALSSLLNEDIKIIASGRTDTGVHAIAQKAHFDSVKNKIPCQQISFALQSFLPKDIAVTDCMEISEDLHARFSAKRKTYIYKVFLNKINLPLYANKYYCYKYEINFNNLLKASEKLIGEHDFKSFMAVGSAVENTVRTIYSLNILLKDKELIFEITANGFLYNMIRIIVGTLLDIGRGRYNLEDMEAIIAAKNRQVAGHTAPAYGLYLKEVFY